jgi:peptidoglycan/xylan/chitin deacetylase (PgdA/CDA1 family)
MRAFGRQVPGAFTLAWRMRSLMPASGRLIARRVADVLLAPLGSISGVALPSTAVGLTFDDGPDPLVTPRLLDLLRERGLHATFFLLTDKVTRHPELVRRMTAEGHEIALHADRHERLTLVAGRELKRRLSAARRRLQGSAGQPVRFFRPPFGAQSIGTYLIARACGLDVVVWGADAHDWVDGPSDVVAARGLDDLHGGDVLLLHDGLERPDDDSNPVFDRVDAFVLMLDGMAARGLQPMTVSELMDTGRVRRTAWFRP